MCISLVAYSHILNAIKLSKLMNVSLSEIETVGVGFCSLAGRAKDWQS